MTAPLIGITTGHAKNKHGFPTVSLLRTYVDATVKAGGVPIIIPPELATVEWQTLYQKLDGIIFSGGADLDPKTFNGDKHPKVYGVDKERDTLEITLMRTSVADKKPFLAICRGMQVLNVALGGTLYTHIADQVPNSLEHDTPDEKERSFLAHDILVEKDTLLANLLGRNKYPVNSWHHQAVKEIPLDLQINAHTTDGVIEGLEIPSHPFALAVQWHPEWMPDDPAMQHLFKAFIQAAQR